MKQLIKNQVVMINMKLFCRFAMVILIVALSSCKDQPDPPPDPSEDPPVELDYPSAPFSRGVNLSDWFLADHADHIGKEVYKTQDFADIKSLGIDVVRIPIRHHKFVGAAPDYVLQSSFFPKLDYAMDLAEAVGIFMILDFHSYFGSTPFPYPKGVDELIKTWQQMAEHCKNRSEKIVFEIMNEPSIMLWPTIQDNVLKAIRAIDPNRYVIVGGTDANSIAALETLPLYEEDDKLIYTFHYYDPFLFSHQGATWVTPSWQELGGIPFPYDAELMPPLPASLSNHTGQWGAATLYESYPQKGQIQNIYDDINILVDFARTRKVPVFCGEFGAMMTTSFPEDRCRYYKTLRECFEDNNISWTMWDYHGTFGLFNKSNDRNFNTQLNVELLKALNFNVPSSYE